MLEMQVSIYFNFLLLFFLQYETFSYWDYEMEKDFWKEEIWKQIFWQMFPNLKKKYSKKFQKIQFPKDSSVFLPYVGKFSFSTRSNLKKNHLGHSFFVNLKVVFRIKNWILNLCSRTKYQKKSVSYFVAISM